LPLQDTWGTESGLLDDFDFFIKEAWFGPNPESDYPDRIYLHFRGPAYVADEIQDDEYEIRYSTGENWEVVGGGDAVEHASGAKKFKTRSACGEFIARIVGANGLGGLAAADPALMKALEATNGLPTEAKTYVGLAFHFELIEGTFEDRVTKEKRTFYRQLPTAYAAALVAEQTKGKGKAASKVEAKPSRGKAKAEVASIGDAALKRAIKKFAAEYADDDFATFVDDVLDPKEFEHADALANNDDLREAVLDEDGGIWSEVHGG